MMFNTIVNIAIIVGGILEFLGIAGGCGFLVWFLVGWYRDRPLSDEQKQKVCESCASYEGCFAVMQDLLPDYRCAYYVEKKKP